MACSFGQLSTHEYFNWPCHCYLQVRLDEVPGLGGLYGPVIVVVQLLVQGPDGLQPILVLHRVPQGQELALILVTFS